jgi:hypothetical protein
MTSYTAAAIVDMDDFHYIALTTAANQVGICRQAQAALCILPVLTAQGLAYAAQADSKLSARILPLN